MSIILYDLLWHHLPVGKYFTKAEPSLLSMHSISALLGPFGFEIADDNSTDTENVFFTYKNRKS